MSPSGPAPASSRSRRRRSAATAATLLLAALLPAEPLTAQQAPLDVTDLAPPAFEAFTGKDGLSDEIWSTVGFDADDFAWAGSASSLAWFDGYIWHPVEFDQARSLVRDMIRTPDGILWAIFEREGLARFDGRRWQLDESSRGFHYAFSSWTRPDGVREIHVARDGGLLRWVGGDWVPDAGRVPGPPGMAVRVARTETLYGAPREWLAVSPGRLFWRPAGRPDGDWRRFDFADHGLTGNLDLAMFTDLLRSVDRGAEELWMLTYGAGVHRLTDRGIDHWHDGDGRLPTEAIYSAVATVDDAGARNLWIASRAGLLRLVDGQVQVYDRSSGLPSDAVRSVKLQPVDNADPILWLATEGGVVRTHLQPSAWQTVSRLGENENGVFGVLLDQDADGSQQVWFGSAREGLVRLSEEGPKHWPASTGDGALLGIHELFGLERADGAPRWKLISTDAGRLLEIVDDTRIVPVDAPFEALGAPAISALARQGDAGLEYWFGTRGGGLWRLRDGQWEAVAEPSPPVNLWALTEQIDTAGRSWLWMASDRGLARYDGESLRFDAASIAAADGGYRDLELVRHAGRIELWASSLRQGVIRFDVADPDAIVPIDDEAIPPPPDPTVYSVLQDSVGRIYICTNNGVQLLMPTSSGRYAERVFRRRDGLVHDECNTGAQAIDAFDRYWVGTLAGLSLFDPALAVQMGAVRQHPLVMTRAIADGERIAARGDTVIPVPAGTRELRVDFVQRTNRRESENRYRSQLLGYDPEPLEWTAETGRQFGALPPGEHRLVVQARDYADVEAVPLDLELSVEPMWWQRTSLRIASAAVLVLLTVFAMLAYNRSLRQRSEQLQRQVAKRTSELNALNARLTELSYRDPLTGLANRRSLTADAYEMLDDAARRHAPIGLVLLDIDRFKTYNDDHGHLAGDSALQVVAQLLREGVRSGDRVARFGGEEFVCLLPGADQDATLRVAENLRRSIEQRTPDALETDGVTISAGIVSIVPRGSDALPTLLARADKALYSAKRAGRNRVEASTG